MKLAVLFSFFTLLSSLSLAQTLPDSICLYDARCTEVQKDLAEQYRNGTSLPAPSSEVLYQGGCYMLSSIYSPETKHHGYVYFRQETTGLGFFGAFSFFYSENPYANMSAKEAHDRHSGVAKYFVQAKDNTWSVEVNSENNWRYFLRKSPSEKTILIGQWGMNDSILCEMTENK